MEWMLVILGYHLLPEVWRAESLEIETSRTRGGYIMIVREFEEVLAAFVAISWGSVFSRWIRILVTFYSRDIEMQVEIIHSIFRSRASYETTSKEIQIQSSWCVILSSTVKSITPSQFVSRVRCQIQHFSNYRADENDKFLTVNLDKMVTSSSLTI